VFAHEPWRLGDGVVHGFLGRRESPTDRRWSAALAAMGIDAPIVTPTQVHGTRVVPVSSPTSPGEADGVVTTARSLALGVVTADCTPVLLRVPGTTAVGAVHAGWRGAAAGILERGVDVLCDVAGTVPGAIEAAVGPAIGPCCYQVGREVREAFERGSGGVTDPAWTPDADRFRLDLRDAVRCLLAATGVMHVTLVGPCTSCSPDLHSHRRDGRAAGRQLSFIAAV
jgi:YfiH family protein